MLFMDCLCKLYVYHLSCFVRVSVWQRKPSPALRGWTVSTLPGIDHCRRRGISSYHHLLGQRHHNPEGDPISFCWLVTEDSTRLGNNHEHKHTITEGHEGDRIWRIELGIRRREKNISILLPNSNKVRWLWLWPSSQVIYLILKVVKKWHSHWWDQTCPQPLVPTPASFFPYDWNLPAECHSLSSSPGNHGKSSKDKDKYSKTAFCSNPDLSLLSDCNPTCLIPLIFITYLLFPGNFPQICHLTFPFPCIPNNQCALD